MIWGESQFEVVRREIIPENEVKNESELIRMTNVIEDTKSQRKEPAKRRRSYRRKKPRAVSQKEQDGTDNAAVIPVDVKEPEEILHESDASVSEAEQKEEELKKRKRKISFFDFFRS